MKLFEVQKYDRPRNENRGIGRVFACSNLHRHRLLSEKIVSEIPVQRFLINKECIPIRESIIEYTLCNSMQSLIAFTSGME